MPTNSSDIITGGQPTSHENKSGPLKPLGTVRRTGIGLLIPIVLIALLIPKWGLSDLYSWTDKDGVVHITNIKPKNRDAKILVPSGQSKAQKKSTPAPKSVQKRSPSAQSQPPRSKPSPSGDSSERMAQYRGLVLEAAERFSLPPALIWAVIRIESSFNPNAVSRAGAEGLMQLMPTTAEGLGVSDSFNPQQNIMGGSRYLRQLANRFNGDLVLTLAAYNAGQGAVLRAMGVPYKDTEWYVRSVLHHYYRYRDQGSP